MNTHMGIYKINIYICILRRDIYIYILNIILLFTTYSIFVFTSLNVELLFTILFAFTVVYS